MSGQRKQYQLGHMANTNTRGKPMPVAQSLTQAAPLTHSFSRELWDQIQTGEKIDPLRAFKKQNQFFATPESVISSILENYVFIGRDHLVLEPSAGAGAFADALKKAYAKYPWCLHTIEKNKSLREILQQKGHMVVGQDFMDYPVLPIYDLVVANPPFVDNSDLLHIMQMFHHLKPGGRVVSIMRDIDLDDREVRTTPYIKLSPSKRVLAQFCAFLDDIGYYDCEKLPKGAFEQSGTSIATQIVVIDKPHYY
jgi:hypothetical protein